MTDPDAELWCIDSFQEFDGLKADYKERFSDNVKAYRRRILLTESTSRAALCNSRDEDCYDFAIIDGSHMAKDVLTDAVLTWDLLKRGGVMIFDDYAWIGQGHEHCTEQDKPRIALDAFVSIYAPEVLHKDYQLIIRKP